MNSDTSIFNKKRRMINCGGQLFGLTNPVVMGIINITPDSLNKLQSWLSKEQINNLDTSMFPSANQISVFLFSINGYDLIASFIKNKDDFSIDCDECFETLTFAETIQVDSDDEWIRCCPDCAKERN